MHTSLTVPWQRVDVLQWTCSSCPSLIIILAWFGACSFLGANRAMSFVMCMNPQNPTRGKGDRHSHFAMTGRQGNQLDQRAHMSLESAQLASCASCSPDQHRSRGDRNRLEIYCYGDYDSHSYCARADGVTIPFSLLLLIFFCQLPPSILLRAVNRKKFHGSCGERDDRVGNRRPSEDSVGYLT